MTNDLHKNLVCSSKQALAGALKGNQVLKFPLIDEDFRRAILFYGPAVPIFKNYKE